MTVLIAALTVIAQEPEGRFDLSVRAKYIGPDYYVHHLLLRLGPNKLEYAVKIRQSITDIDVDGNYTVHYETMMSKAWTNGKGSDTAFKRHRDVDYRADWFQSPTFLVGDAGHNRLANLLGYRPPRTKLNMGNSWSYTAAGEPGWSSTYKFSDVQTVNEQEAAIIEITSKTTGSDPATASGRIAVSLATGLILDMSVKARNLPMAGAKADATFMMEPATPDVPLPMLGGGG